MAGRKASNLTKPCSRCVFVSLGHKCPDCGQISTPNYSLSYLPTQESLYGTSYGRGRYNEGLGERTFGKNDFRKKVAEKGLRQREPGEKIGKSPIDRAAANDKAQISRIVSEAVRHL